MAERKPLFVGAFGAQEMDPTADSATLAGLTISTSAGIDMGGFKITNLDDPTSAQDAATKSYVDAVATGLDWKQSVRLATAAALPTVTAAGTGVGKTLTASANGALSVDGVAVSAGDRILVKNQVAQDDNGIYVVTDEGDGSNPFVLTRATDADQDAEVTAGLATFVTEGSTLADTGWVLTTNDPIVVDTTNLVFAQFSSTTSVSYGAGLLLTSGVVDVELDTGADAQGAGSGGGTSGLEFDTSGAGGKLRVRVSATGGINRFSDGIGIEIDDTPDTLDVGANGLKVTGLPLQFKINGSAVSTSVTQANVDTLVAGVLSSADALHRHGKLEQAYNVDAGVTAGDPVYFSSDNEITKANASGGTGQKVIGVTRTTQASVGAAAQVVRAGPCAGVLSGATAGDSYWLASGGGLTATPPTGNVDRVLIGYAINATDLDVRIQYIGKLLS